MNPYVEAAVFETARGGILREGLAFDRCDVAVVTNIGEGDHLGLSDVHNVEALAKVKRCIVDVVPPNGTSVLNANDPHCVAMAPYSAGRICYFALDGNHAVIVRHRGVGGQAIFVRDNMIVLAEGAKEEAFMPVNRVPLTRGGTVSFHVENTLAAIAAALAMKIPADMVRERAESFTADLDKVPARFNMLEIHGATVVVDYGHNADALGALISVMDKFPHQRRSCVYTRRGRSPRLRPGPPGRTARQRVRPRNLLRGPLPPRPCGRRDHPSLSERGGKRQASEGNPRDPRR